MTAAEEERREAREERIAIMSVEGVPAEVIYQVLKQYPEIYGTGEEIGELKDEND